MPIIKNKDDLSMNITDIMKEVMEAGEKDVAAFDSTLREEWGLITHSPDLLYLIGIDGILLESMENENLLCILHKSGAFIIEDHGTDPNALPLIEVIKQLHLYAPTIRSIRTIAGKKPKDLELISQLDVQLVKEDKYGPN